jgi:glycosyltransferase involved in cell wall biosynthesis
MQQSVQRSDADVVTGNSTNQGSAWSGKRSKPSTLFRIALLADAGHVNIQRWCEGLTRAGAEVHVLSFRDGETNGWKVYPLPVLPLLGKVQYFACVPYVRRLIDSIKPHVLACYYVTGYGTLGSLTAFHPIIQITSGSDLLLAGSNPIMRKILKHNLGRADLVTAWAPHMAEAALANGASVEKLMILPRGIPVQRFVGARCKKRAKDNVVRIISTRSLRSVYKLDLLLQTAQLLRQDGMRFTLTLAGDGPLRQELISQAKRAGLMGHVKFSGFVSNDDLAALLAQHDLYVSLSPTDGVSASLLEAMAVGLFPIVADHPANRMWIDHQRNGLLLDHLTATSVARAIRKAASDVDLMEKASNVNSEAVVKRADLDLNCEQYVLRFRQLWHDHLLAA